MIESFLNLETGKQQSRSNHDDEPAEDDEELEQTHNQINMEKIIQENSKNTYRWESKK